MQMVVCFQCQSMPINQCLCRDIASLHSELGSWLNVPIVIRLGGLLHSVNAIYFGWGRRGVCVVRRRAMQSILAGGRQSLNETGFGAIAVRANVALSSGHYEISARLSFGDCCRDPTQRMKQGNAHPS